MPPLNQQDDSHAQKNLKLVLLGACRGPDDQARIDALKKLSVELGVQVGKHTYMLVHVRLKRPLGLNSV